MGWVVLGMVAVCHSGVKLAPLPSCLIEDLTLPRGTQVPFSFESLCLGVPLLPFDRGVDWRLVGPPPAEAGGVHLPTLGARYLP